MAMFLKCSRSLLIGCRFFSTHSNYSRKADVSGIIAAAGFCQTTSGSVLRCGQGGFKYPLVLSINAETRRIPVSLPTFSGFPQSISSPSINILDVLDPARNGIIFETVDPRPNILPFEEPEKPTVYKECVRKGVHIRIIHMKRRRKHQYRKRMKKMFRISQKYRERRRKKRDLLFQADMLAKIREADEFTAENYVKDILKKITDRPPPETRKQANERYTDLRRKNRSNVNIIPPKFQRGNV